MSRNGKSFKNPPSKIMLKTVFKQSTSNNKDFNLSPLNMKIETNITITEYLSFYANESINKGNKKNLNKNKINYLFKNYSKNKNYNTLSQAKKMSRNNPLTKNLILNKTNIKRCSSISKTIANTLFLFYIGNISFKFY